MENASKALLIAGGVLIVIILVSMILLVKNNVVNFYASQDELQEISDKTKFNEQFTRFNRNDVAGYELISLSNKIIDYNERLSSEGKNNDEKGEPIAISITIWDNKNNKIKKDNMKTLFCANNDYDFMLFKSNEKKYELITKTTLTQENVKDNEIKRILDSISNISTPKIEILTKKVFNIIPNNFVELKNDNTWYLKNNTISENDQRKMIDAISSYRSAVGNQDAYTYSNINELPVKYLKMLNDNDNGINILKYYEYTQFLKAKFKCKKLEYSNSTGKVISLEFECTGEIE